MLASSISRSPFRILMLFFIGTIVGVILIPKLNIQLKPQDSGKEITIHFSMHKASSRVVEIQVTSVLEGALSRLNDIEEVHSVSKEGGGSLSITFKATTNFELARFEVASTIRSVYPYLPSTVSYPSIEAGGFQKEPEAHLSYRISATSSTHLINDYVSDKIIPGLSRINGVADVSLYGTRSIEWNVSLDLQKMARLNLKANQVMENIMNHLEAPVLGIDRQSDLMVIQLSSKHHDIRQQIPILQQDGHIIYLEDIASIRLQEQEIRSHFRIDGNNAIGLAIYAKKGINGLTLSKEIKAFIEQVQQKLPPNYYIQLGHDSSSYLIRELNKIAKRAILSVFVLLLLIYLISFSWRYLLMVSTSLFVNLLLASILYYFFDVQIQLYSLAGIAISLGFIIDNVIMVTDSVKSSNRKHIFWAVFSANMTTLGALSCVFFLKPELRVFFEDFVLVLSFNLTVSLAVSYYFVPALANGLNLRRSKNSQRKALGFSTVYFQLMSALSRRKWIFILLLVAGFGLPIHLLPEKMNNQQWTGKVYNSLLNNEFFIYEAKPLLETWLGGALTRFTKEVYSSSFYNEPGRMALHITAIMPVGSTVGHLNKSIKQIESYLNKYDQIDYVETHIFNHEQARVNIFFKPQIEQSNFPYFLKNYIKKYVLNIGGVSWSVYGVGMGFQNTINADMKNSYIRVEGYNYKQLERIVTDFSDSLALDPLIDDLEIASDVYFFNKPRKEFRLTPIQYQAVQAGLDSSQLKNRLTIQNCPKHQIIVGNQAYSLGFSMTKNPDYWNLQNTPISNVTPFRLKNLITEDTLSIGLDIHKFNQAYRLYLSYNYLGPPQHIKTVEKANIEALNSLFSVGFRATTFDRKLWNAEDSSQYILIVPVLFVILGICAISLESLIYPLIIIVLVPLSFIGHFMTFYILELNFDQGGYSSLILLAGLVVNSAIYIIYEYLHLLKTNSQMKAVEALSMSFQRKSTPILLTVFSTVVGLIPFILDGQNDVFWFAFASGTIGGLLFSLIGLFIYLPILILPTKNKWTNHATIASGTLYNVD